MIDRLALAESQCWKRIGIHGDRSCEELEYCVHCRSCPVYHLAGRRLLDRPIPAEYREEWRRRLAEIPETPDPDSLGLMVFRVAGHWLALPSSCLDATLNPAPVRKVPHRGHRHFLGLVNAQGELQLCFTLEHLLDPHGAETTGNPAPTGTGRAFPRLLVIKVRGQRWAFPADEVLGIERQPRARLQPPPAHLRLAPDHPVTALCELEGLRVSLLDPERLAARFAEAVR